MRAFTICLINLILFCTLGCGITENSKISEKNTPNDMLIGKWLLVEYGVFEPLRLNDTICFNTDGSYYRNLNESGNWSYSFYTPDSLIVFNKDFGEQRFKIIGLSNDSLIIQLKENVIYSESVDTVKSESIERFVKVF